MEERGITAEPIEISRLLEEDPATREQKEKGWMVNDNTVLNLLLRRLLDDDYSNGAVVDGFPRTEVQGLCVFFLCVLGERGRGGRGGSERKREKKRVRKGSERRSERNTERKRDCKRKS